ncbi:ComEC/Rec2 family competence protein [Sphingosinicella sp. YJ22]|uniref:ComEC/Rec2 family competence protein n=1 Tax=Sphingosinicella sp. YJ22 TaxID=1104780 RepID=UPI00140D14D1|nr:ComEC/Rec2 family competence protein [Sphingosinicella sp. YJ22]
MTRLRRAAGAIEARLEAEREQLPLWVPVGLIAGIAAWFALPGPALWAAFLATTGAAALAALVFARGSRAAAAVAWFSLFVMIGCALIWLRAESVAAPRLERPQAARFTATIVRADRLAARDQMRLLLAPMDAPALPPQVRVAVPLGRAPDGLVPGATVRLRAFLMPPPPMAVPGAYDFARTAWFARIGATGRLLGDVEMVTPLARTGWQAWLAGLRQRLSAHIQGRLPGSEGAIAAALATGDQGGVGMEDAEAMRASGLAHLLSVSGLHITAVVGGTILLALRLLALSPWLALRVNLVLAAAAIAALTGIAYTLLTGAEVPTIRSCIAALLVLAGLAMGRDAITLRLVATGAIVVLLFWPESLAGPSFQLSFAAVAAIVALHEHPRIKALLARRDEGAGSRFGRALLALLLTGVAVELAIAPIALFHFHQAGLYGALANIAAIPLTTFVIMPLEALALLLDLVGLGAPFWWAAGQGLGLLLAVAHGVAGAPGAVALMPAIPPAAFALFVAGLLWIGLWRTRWRWWGAAPAAVGAAWALLTPPPDLLVTGDGRHLALRTPTGDLAILRPRAGDYVRDLLAELSGSEPDFVEIAAARDGACSDALCRYELRRHGRAWHILATTSRDFVRWDEMIAACAAADIVVSDRALPAACRPRWLRADRPFLAEHGGLAFTFGRGATLTTVRDQVGARPWRATAR